MDEKFVELAGERTQAEIDAGIDAARKQARPPADWDGKTCYDCGDEIAAERLRITGSCRCIDCARIAEQRSRTYR